MSDPCHGIVDGCNCLQRRGGWPLDQVNGDSKRPGGGDLAVSGGTAAVLGDDHIDGVFAQQRFLVGLDKRSARLNVADSRYFERGFDGVDASHEIIMLRRLYQGGELPATEGDKYLLRGFAERGDRGSDIRKKAPAVTRSGDPWRPDERECGNAGTRDGGDGVFGYLPREGMSGVDQEINGIFADVSGEAGGTAETACADRYHVGHRGPGAARQRHGHLEQGVFGEALGQLARFEGSAEDQDSDGHDKGF